MSTEAKRQTKSPNESLRGRARELLAMLLVQFLAGIAVGLIGMPMQKTGFAKIGSSILLIVHVLVAVAMLVSAFLAVARAARVEPPLTGLAWGGGVTVVITVAAGVLTLATGSGWWSYLMAAGAIASLPLYGILYVRTLS